VLLASGLAIVGATLAIPAFAYTAPDHSTQFTLEACRHDEGIALPNGSGDFICDDSKYTSGNLKTWAELDLLPHRLTAKTSDVGGTYNVVIGADYLLNSKVGYDVIDLVQTDSPGCSVSASTASTGHSPPDPSSTATGVTGGVDTIIYRVLTITQPANSTCVVNWVNRIAVGAHLYSGASLQSYMFEKDDFAEGKRTLSLPVNQVLPQGLSKTMSASQGTAYSWTLSKSASKARVQFDDTCNAENSLSQGLNVKIEWVREAGVPGSVRIKTIIKATNPATRSIHVTATDTIKSGTTALDTLACNEAVVPANTSNLTICEHVFLAAPDVTDLNDVATGSYHDAITGIPIPGTTTATASTTIAAGELTNATAVVNDSESLTGTGLTFKVTGTSAGSATGTFSPTIPMSPTQGPVTWASGTQTGTGFVEFNKLVYVPFATQTSGTLTDSASLTGSNGFTANAGPVNVVIEAYAKVTLTIKKTIPNILQGSDSAKFTFVVTKGATTVATKELVFAAGETYKEVDVKDLEPGVAYVVTETPEVGWAVNPPADTAQNVTINLPVCSGSVSFYNDIAPAEFAHAQVKKVTLPAGSEAGWDFTLQRCAKLVGCVEADFSNFSTATTTDADFEVFWNGLGPLDLLEGTYRVIESGKAGWENLGGVGCEFTVDYDASIGQVYSCTYTNRHKGTIIIKKVTVPAETVDPKSFGFTDNIASPNLFSLVHGGQKTFENVLAGASYNVIEDADATGDYALTSIVCDDGASATPSTVSLGDRKAVVKLDPNETVTCTFTNTKQGRVQLMKLTNGQVRPDLTINFVLYKDGSSLETKSTFGDADGLLLFATKLVPGTTYRICESPVPAGYNSYWKLNGSIVTPYNPDASSNPPEDNGVRCYDFSVSAGATADFLVENSYPGGGPRTIGYWKNWSRCTGGGQVKTAEMNGGAANGFFLIDDLLPQVVGDLNVSACAIGVDILDKRMIANPALVADGDKMAKDAAYGLAAQLLAAKLNLAAGAVTCPAVQSAVLSGQTLLDNIGFLGTGTYLVGKSANRTLALDLATSLDNYNNGMVCP
jgi:hypothetical protein